MNSSLILPELTLCSFSVNRTPIVPMSGSVLEKELAILQRTSPVCGAAPRSACSSFSQPLSTSAALASSTAPNRFTLLFILPHRVVILQ